MKNVNSARSVERPPEEREALVRFQEFTLIVERRSDNSIGRVPVFQTGNVGSSPARCNMTAFSVFVIFVGPDSADRLLRGGITGLLKQTLRRL